MPTIEMQRQRQEIAKEFASYRNQANKWYKSARWRKIRKNQLARHPFCQCPHHKGRNTKAEVVDHITPHRGDPRLFWNTSNLQSMSKVCHDSMKQSEERGGRGFDRGCDELGNPLNNEDWWKSQGADKD